MQYFIADFLSPISKQNFIIINYFYYYFIIKQNLLLIYVSLCETMISLLKNVVNMFIITFLVINANGIKQQS